MAIKGLDDGLLFSGYTAPDVDTITEHQGTSSRFYSREEPGRQDAKFKEDGMTRRLRFAAWVILLSALRVWAQAPILAPLLSGLDQPVFLTHARDGSNRKFIVEQPGRILVMQPDSTATAVYLDIHAKVLSGGEQGLLGLAFHPQYASNGRFFIDYTRQPDGATVIAEYRVSDVNPNAADPESEVVLLTVSQPFANHNGGMVEFGPDNYLYIGMGDGGSANDPANRAQNVNELLGKILRIDVDHEASPALYSSPSSNPFFGSTAGRDEVFAFGFRNPWRFSFDRLNGQLYAGDVGQSAREEIDIVTSGGNYGWRVLEGTRCTGLGPASCSALQATPPITEYATGQLGRCAVTGGYVYRGSRRSLPYGAYVFGDFCSGEIFLFQGGATSVLLDTSLSISSFGEDESGEIYVVGLNGSISRITSASSSPVTQRQFSIPSRGGVVLPSNGTGPLTSGYVRIQAASGDALPRGLAIFGWRQNGILVSEAAVPASSLVQSGRIFALAADSITTGIAIANPNASPVNVDFHFTSAAGQDLRHGSLTIPANGQISGFLDQSPFNGGTAVNGTFTFRASLLVSVMAIRGVFNERSEFLMSTLPIVPINATILTAAVFPHWAIGEGWTTEFIVVNPSDVLITGLIRLTDPANRPVETLNYSVPPRSSRRLFPTTESPAVRTGAAQLVATGGPLPSAAAVFRLTTSAGIVTETIVPATATAIAFRGYGEFSAVARNALAIANTSQTQATVTIELRNLDGTLRDTGSIDLAPSAQDAFFLDEVPGIDSGTPFQGIVRISSTTPIAVASLRSHINERGDFLIAATAPDNVADSITGSDVFFPHLAVGGGSDMQFVLINPQTTGVDSGIMNFLAPNGRALQLMVP